ncbi:MAG TPA: PD-(D/E)XK nuclease family protein [Thermoanaerobaculia bacterium]|nr:PD-(D/E)XK nuclease family protein [Thermoanaerobaculia bacterium]
MAEQRLLPFGEKEKESPPRHVEELAKVCRERPLEEKVLVAPSLQVGYQIVEALARSGQAWVNLRVETVRTLAHTVIGPSLAREKWKLLSRAQSLALVEQACAEALTEKSYFGSLADRPGLHRSFQRTFDELRAAGLSAETLPEGAFADRRKHRELREVLRRYTSALEAGRYVDGIEVLRRALDAVERGSTSTGAATYLVVGSMELSSLERSFLEKLAAGRLVLLAADPPGAWKAIGREARLLRSLGEENEIREIFRILLEEGIPFDDAEVLHTDAGVYPALFWELSREHGIPCTFAGGVPVSYTRPGQAALAFLDWIGQGFAAEVLRKALASGALTLSRLGGSDDAPGTRAAARALREAGIGWGRERHLSCLERLVAKLEQTEERGHTDADSTDEQRARREEWRARQLAAAIRARDFARRALALAPESGEGSGDLRSLAQAARTFVSEFARAADELDGTARTALDALFAEFGELLPLRLTAAAAVERLRDAVALLSIAADRPRPGRVHVAHYRAGGFSGRRRTFLVGLDEARLPGRDLEDPVLLDEERKRINDEAKGPLLALGREKPREAAAAFRACLGRLRGEIAASYSSFDLRNLSMAGEPAPSPVFLDLFRERSANPGADYSELAAALPRAAGFAPREDAALDDTEWWLSRLRQGGGSGVLAPIVRSVYPWLEDGRRAEEARAGDEFTAWDGFVPSGTPELDPCSGGEPFSPSRVQELASCPFKYFVKHVLRVEAPEDIEADPTRWLAPMDEGSLLHEVFRDFFERITAAGEKPETARHLDLILQIAEGRIDAWRDRVPPRSELAFTLQRENILFACRTLLAREEEHCREVTPRHFEVPFGLPRQISRTRSAVASPDPVAIEIGPGRSFRLRGSIDRVDEGADGTYEVWDYKTGSPMSVREGTGVRGGRQVQPVLYAMALETLLDRAGMPGTVSKSGYFFPGRKGEGQRIVTPLDRGQARQVLGRLFDLLSAGMFPHAVTPDDCKFCDFEAICGGAKEASARAKTKLAASTNEILASFRELHAEEND